MNKLITGVLLASSLFLIDVSPAAAHEGAERVRVHSNQGHYDSRRHDAMPKWLKRNRQFRHWYRHSPLRRYRNLGWSQLYDIYRWERRYFSRRYYSENAYDGRKRRHRYD